jgi:hypothetical protein
VTVGKEPSWRTLFEFFAVGGPCVTTADADEHPCGLDLLSVRDLSGNFKKLCGPVMEVSEM